MIVCIRCLNASTAYETTQFFKINRNAFDQFVGCGPHIFYIFSAGTYEKLICYASRCYALEGYDIKQIAASYKYAEHTKKERLLCPNTNYARTRGRKRDYSHCLINGFSIKSKSEKFRLNEFKYIMGILFQLPSQLSAHCFCCVESEPWLPLPNVAS